ncbi:MAG TPA: MlaD family protein [Solirubrobacteraceae bacterium]|jgi:virulence factor Mce-like protein
MSSTRKAVGTLFDDPILLGTLTILVVAVAVYLSYIAENGLPFIPTYRVNVDVESAGQLIKNADVRIGGARVGQVLTISPEPETKAWPHPYAELGLALNRSLAPLPSDTHYRVRLASVLGGNYLEIVPGHDRRGGLADGGTFTLSTDKARNHDLGFVDLDQAFQTFGPRTRNGLRGSLAELGGAVAGRGSQLNDSIVSLDELMGPLQSVLKLLAAPHTRLPQFIDGLAATTAALAPAAPTLDSLLRGGATTLAALSRSSLGKTIDQLPPTEAVATRVLTRSQPVLAEAAEITQELKPGVAQLPVAAQRTDQIVDAATPVFDKVPKLASSLSGAVQAVDALARDPASSQVFEVLGSSDLGTTAASAFLGLGAILRSVSTAQFACNAIGLWVRNFASALTEGDRSGGWLRFSPIFDLPQTFQAATPAADLHLNYYPVENSSQCQAGNEGYAPGQLIGNPPQTSRTVDDTAPPPGVLDRGRKAGLVP